MFSLNPGYVNPSCSGKGVCCPRVLCPESCPFGRCVFSASSKSALVSGGTLFEVCALAFGYSLAYCVETPRNPNTKIPRPHAESTVHLVTARHRCGISHLRNDHEKMPNIIA